MATAAAVAAKAAVPAWWRDAEVHLGQVMEGFAPRAQQAELVAVMDAAAGSRSHAAVEAPTGSGKSIAALMVAERFAGRVVISTATRALQEQYRTVDVPRLRDAGLLTKEVVVLEGRGRFVCRARAESEMGVVSPAGREVLQRLLQSDLGDGRRDSLEVVVPDWLWERVCSDTDACKALGCTGASCSYLALRDLAREAGIVIVNHHVLLADAAIKDGGAVAWGRRSAGAGDRENLAVLGPYRLLIVDEAHALEAAAESFGERRVSLRGIQALASRVQRLDGSAGAVNMLGECRAEVEAVIEGLPQGCLIEPLGGDRVLAGASGWADRAAREVRDLAADSLEEGMRGEVLSQLCFGLAKRLDAIDEALVGGSDEFGARAPSAGDGSLVSQLVDAGPWLAAKVWDQVPSVLMSGTLSVPGRDGFVVERLGLPVPVVGLGTVFDLRAQRLVYVTPRADAGGGARSGPDDIEELMGLLEASAGRALVLFPAFHDLRVVHDAIVGRVPHRVLGQGVTLAEDQPKKRGGRRTGARARPVAGAGVPMPASRLAEVFREDTSSVLLATRSFFEGVDFPGEACSLVVVMRFPNLRPDDPLTLARRNAIEAGGGNAWVVYQEPAMQLLFRQAAGRVIRRVDDRGVVAVLDPRSGSKAYAKRALLGLVPSDFTDSLEDVRVFLGGERSGSLF